jgi:hypothetical protein
MSACYAVRERRVTDPPDSRLFAVVDDSGPSENFGVVKILVLVALVGACKLDSTLPEQPDATAPACDRTQPFGEPMPIPGINTAGGEAFANLTQDRLTVIFDMEGEIYQATRLDPNDDFGQVTKLENVNDPDNIHYDGGSVISRDRRTLYFESSRGGTLDIYVASRDNPEGTFGEPELLVGVNDPTMDEAPAWISADGTELYLYRRPAGGFWDTYRVTRANTQQTFGTPMLVPPLNLPDRDECCSVLTDDQLEVFFSDDGPMNLGSVLHATRSTTDDGFGTPTALFAPPIGEFPNWVSADGCFLTLTSRGRGGQGNSDLFIAARPPVQ